VENKHIIMTVYKDEKRDRPTRRKTFENSIGVPFQSEDEPTLKIAANKPVLQIGSARTAPSPRHDIWPVAKAGEKLPVIGNRTGPVLAKKSGIRHTPARRKTFDNSIGVPFQSQDEPVKPVGSLDVPPYPKRPATIPRSKQQSSETSYKVYQENEVGFGKTINAVPASGKACSGSEYWEVPVETFGTGVFNMLGATVASIVSAGRVLGCWGQSNTFYNSTTNNKSHSTRSSENKTGKPSQALMSGHVVDGARHVSSSVIYAAKGIIKIVFGFFVCIGKGLAYLSGTIMLDGKSNTKIGYDKTAMVE
jgi:hypothetical protein